MSQGEHFRLLLQRAALERPQYEANDYISAKQLQSEQHYRLERLWHHNRYLHGEGVVCGLQVVPARIAAQPWAVRVCPGYAFGCCGEEIEVRSPALLDIRESLWNRPTEDGHPVRDAFIAIGYAEELVKPRAISAGHCGCEDMTYEPSRARDGYRLGVLWTNKLEPTPAFDMCVPAVSSCPACAGRAYVVLARITLPENESDPIKNAQIDNAVRRRQFGTSAAQRQLIDCCCEEKPLRRE